MITQARVRELFTYREGQLYWIHTNKNTEAGEQAGHLTARGVTLVGIDGKSYLLHRVIWLFFNPDLPPLVDHKNRIKTDNRIENLRAATRSQNNTNAGTRTDSKSQFKGVFFSRAANKWVAGIQKDKKRIYLGQFDSPDLAALAYNKAALELHGEFACLNVI